MRVDTDFFFVDRPGGPVQVLGVDDIFDLEREELEGAVRALEALLACPFVFERAHLEALRGAREVINDLLHPEPNLEL